MEFLYIALIAFAGSLVQASTGFGFAIVSMTLWPLIMPFRDAAVMEVITALIMVTGLTVRMRRHINFKLMLFPLIASLLTSSVGIFTMMSGTESLLRRIFGGVLVLLSIYFIFFSSKIHLAFSPKNGLAAGAVSGFFSGLFNLGGPPMVVYFLSVTDDKMEYSATLQCYFLFNGIFLFINHLLLGNVNAQVLEYSGIALIGLAFGTLAGFSLFKKFSIQTIKKMVYTFMVVFGLFLLIKG